MLNVTSNSWNTAGTHTLNAVVIDRSGGTLNLAFNGNSNLSRRVPRLPCMVNGDNVANTSITGFAGNSVHGNTGGTGIDDLRRDVRLQPRYRRHPAGGRRQPGHRRLGQPRGRRRPGAHHRAGKPLLRRHGHLCGGGHRAPTGRHRDRDDPRGHPAAPDGSGTSVIDADNGPALDISSAPSTCRLDDLDSNTCDLRRHAQHGRRPARTDSDASISKTSRRRHRLHRRRAAPSRSTTRHAQRHRGGGVSNTSNTGDHDLPRGHVPLHRREHGLRRDGGGTITSSTPPARRTTRSPPRPPRRSTSAAPRSAPAASRSRASTASPRARTP